MNPTKHRPVRGRLTHLARGLATNREAGTILDMDQNDPAAIKPPEGRFTEAEMATWPQFAGVRRIFLSGSANEPGSTYEDQFLFVRSLHEGDARAHFKAHGFAYRGRLAFNVTFETAPPWLINLSLWLGRLF